jgi:hypothetical protein
MSSNGGFPPLKIIKQNNNNNYNNEKLKRKEKTHKNDYKKDNINLNIKNILSNSVVKPMIDLNKPAVDKVIDSL